MAIVPVQTQDTLDKVYLSETTKQVFDKINQNSAQEDIRADRTDANFQYLDTEVQSKQPSFSDGSAGIASVSNDIVTLKSGITQSGGTISNDSGSDIALAKVAKTGAYSDLSGQPSIPTKDSDLTNDRYVRYDTGSQGLTDTQKSNARTNIGAGTVASVGATSGSGIAIGGTATAPTVGIDSSHKLPTTTEYNSLATKTYVDTAIDNLPEPMVFKGTLGTGGTITTLPAASASNEGFTYKVITAGTYASQSAKVGDVFISNGTEWVLIPSGDDIEDTWRAINVNGSQLKGNGITSGAINFKNGGNVTVTGSGSDITLGVARGYSIPSTTQQNAWTNKQDALDTQTAYTAKGTSTKVPTITTNALGQVTAIVETDIAFPTVDLSGKMDKVDPTGTGSFSLNRISGATIGRKSFAAGENVEASGAHSVAFGLGTASRGESSFAVGVLVEASGINSMAFGNGTRASGAASHAEGVSSLAFGDASHAEGYKTTAQKHCQHTFGKYNVVDNEDNPLNVGTGFGRYVEIVGNGTAGDALSNARTLDWNGNEVLAGTSTATGFKTPSGMASQFLKADGSIDSNKYATETYVDDAIAAVDQKTVLSFDATGWTAGSDGYYTKTIATTKYPINCFNSNNKVVMATLGVTKSGDAVSAITVESDTPFAGYVVAL